MKVTSIGASALLILTGREHMLLGVAGVILAGFLGLAVLVAALQGRVNISIGGDPHQPP